jgi:hypothetical protein
MSGGRMSAPVEANRTNEDLFAWFVRLAVN